eukprot:SAG25_NODE_13361_length_268_cov_0.615385_1_plen_37_part_10
MIILIRMAVRGNAFLARLKKLVTHTGSSLSCSAAEEA